MNTTSWITLILIICFFAVMIMIGIRTKRHALDVNGFVLGGDPAPWVPG